MFDWPHAPLHRFSSDGLYFVTGATYQKQHFYRRSESLNRFVRTLFRMTREHAIALQAWTIFSNHYHIVADAKGESLRTMLSRLHTDEAIACNVSDRTPGRKVWFQFRETQLTFERSWLARLRYTHENAVKHGLVIDATRYPWSSAGWFERNASPAFAVTLRRFKIDRVNVSDEFETLPAEP